MRYLLATCTLIGTLFLSLSNAQAVSVRVDIEPGKRILAPRDAIKFVVRPSGSDVQTDTSWMCKANLMDQAAGASVWSEEKELSGTKAIASGISFHKKAPKQAGVYQLEIELQSQQSTITQKFPLIVVAEDPADRKGIASLLGGRSDSAVADKNEGSLANEGLLAKWYSASELGDPLGLSGATTTESIDWTQVFQKSEQFISDLQTAGFDAAALPLAADSTILFPMAGPKGKRLANASEVDILELLFQRADQAGVKLYLTLPGKAVSATSPAVGGNAMVAIAPIMVLENANSIAYATAYDSSRHKIPWVVSRAVRQIGTRYAGHESLAAIVVDNRAVPTTSLNNKNLSSLHALPVVEAAGNSESTLNQLLAEQLALTDAKIFFVSGQLRDKSEESLSWKTISQSQETQRLRIQLTSVRSEIEAMRLHRIEQCLLNPSFETALETAAENQIPGWQTKPTAHAEASLDPSGSHAGEQCIRLQSQVASKDGVPAVMIQSGSFELPSTRRLAVLAWMRVDPELPVPDVSLVLEGLYNNETFRHSVEAAEVLVDSAGSSALGDQWMPVTLQLDDLPLDGISELSIHVELHSAGSVWVDDLQVSDMWLTDAEHSSLTRSIDRADDNLTAGRLPEAREFIQHQLPANISKFGTLEYLAPSLVSNSADSEPPAAPQQQAELPADVAPEPVAVEPARRLPVVADAAPTVSQIAESAEESPPKSQLPQLANAPVAMPLLPALSETSLLAIGSGTADLETVDLETDGPADPERPWWKLWGTQPEGTQSEEAQPESLATSKWSRRTRGRSSSPGSRPQANQDFSRPQATVASIWSYLKQDDKSTVEPSETTTEVVSTEPKRLQAVQVVSAESQTTSEPSRLFGFIPRLGQQTKASDSADAPSVAQVSRTGPSETANDGGSLFGWTRLLSPGNDAAAEPIAGGEPTSAQSDSFSLFSLLAAEPEEGTESIEAVKTEAVQIAEAKTAEVEQRVSRIAQLLPRSQPSDSSPAAESSESSAKPGNRFVKPFINFFR